MRGTLRTFSVAAAGALALLITAFAGTAVAKDRNHDQIPDKWEKRYHLSLKVDQANKDQDHDTVGNLDEFQDGTSPRDSDSDNDGVLDGNDDQEGVDDQGDDPESEPNDQGDDNDQGEDNQGDDNGGDQSDEIAGVIASFENGVLTINVDGGGQVSGAVDSNTEIECQTADESEVGDDSSPGLESDSGDIEEPGDEGPGDDGTPGGDDVQEPDQNACTADDLTQGTTVHEAELENGTFTEVELVK